MKPLAEMFLILYLGVYFYPISKDLFFVFKEVYAQTYKHDWAKPCSGPVGDCSVN